MAELEKIAQWLGLFGVIGIVIYAPLTKTVLGAVLAVVGAFFPSLSSAQKESVEASLYKVRVVARGTARIGILAVALVIECAAMIEGVGRLRHMLQEIRTSRAEDSQWERW